MPKRDAAVTHGDVPHVESQVRAAGRYSAMGETVDAFGDIDEAPDGLVASSDDVAASTFQLLYESRDKRLCLFEDAEGHLTAVRTSRLA